MIRQLLCTLERYFPKATIIGTSTAGTIQNGETFDHAITLSITTFEKSRLRLIHLKETTPEESFASGEYLAGKITDDETKALILFSDYHTVRGDKLLEGIKSSRKDLIIAGGVAAYEENRSMLISNYGISTHGVVAVALQSKSLYLQHHYKSDWLPFGKKLLITHARGNRVYTIDHTPATEIFAHYLGENFMKHFDDQKFLFPLIKVRNKQKIARCAMKLHDDGAIEFAGNFNTGEIYRFGFANLEDMLKNHNLPVCELSGLQDGAIFVYSCVARKRFMQKQIQEEIAPLTQCAPVSGFFTYGEFYSDRNETYLLNQTMTILSMSETPSQTCRLSGISSKKQHASTLDTLSHLMLVTESETQHYYRYLEQKEALLCQGPVVHFKIDLNRNFSCSYVSKNVKNMLGYSSKELINSEISLLELADPRTLEEIGKDIAAFLEDDNIAYETQIRVKAKFGDTKYLKVYLSTQKNGDTENRSIVGYCIDVTQQVESEEKIRKLAFYDHITGLPNRELLKKRLTQEIEKAKHSNKICAVTFFDLDKFKDVNDTYGHSIGDTLLQMVANRVKAILNEGDFIARIGGDEFLIIHSQLSISTFQTHILATINKILTIIHEPFSIEGKIAHISTSIGTAVYGVDGESVEDLIRHADMAMYAAKKDPDVHFRFYSHTMRILRQEELELKNALKEAVRNRDFTLLYQPQVDTASGRVVGAEALMRWYHPVKGSISPVEFIPLAEELNLIVDLGEWLLEEVCHKIQHLQSLPHLPEDFRGIAVNISPLQFKDPYFVSKVRTIVDLLQIDTRYLEFELTEGILVEDIEAVAEKMRALKAMGITLSLDDFGTGYASLNYLKKLPIDTIKIDRSFISNLQKDRTDQLLTSTIIQLSQNMQCKIVAEGVENLEQLTFLEQNNCNTYQGFYFSKPVTFEAFEALLYEEQRRRRDSPLIDTAQTQKRIDIGLFAREGDETLHRTAAAAPLQYLR